MVSLSDLKVFISGSLGIDLPDFILQAALDSVASVQPCLDGAGYSVADMMFIQLYSATLIATAADVRKIKSQSAPNGAGRSFEYGKGMQSMRSKLQSLDKSGCTAKLVAGSSGQSMVFVVTGVDE